MYKILIVEDDPVIAGTLEAHLGRWGYEAKCVEDFERVDTAFLAFDPQLVLLDILLPCYNGYHWCAQLRKITNAPILFLSSAGDNLNIVMAMNMGADDFIAKPFDLSVLTAKIQALLRRAYALQGQVHVLERAGALLHLGEGILTYGQKKAELTKNESRILQTLMENPGRVVSRDTMMARLWESDAFIDDNTLTVNVARLRKKLEDVGLCGFILTKKGAGYLVK